MFYGPASLLEWVLTAAGAAAFLVFAVGIGGLSARPGPHSRLAAFVNESAIACALIHGIGIVSRRVPSAGWAGAGIFLYFLATVIFLTAIERTRRPILAKPIAASAGQSGDDRSLPLSGPSPGINVAFAIAWAAGPVATHSPTLLVTAVIMISLQALTASKRR